MPRQDNPELNPTYLIASGAATITATVAASYFGVAGTLIGAGVVSVLSTCATALYQHYLDRGRARIAARIPVRSAAGKETPTPSARGGDHTGGRSRPKWYVLLGGAAGTFAVVMGLVTAFELVTGKPLTNTVQRTTGHGTSWQPATSRPHPSPLPRASGRPGPVHPTPAESTAYRPTPTPGGTSPRPSATTAVDGPVTGFRHTPSPAQPSEIRPTGSGEPQDAPAASPTP